MSVCCVSGCKNECSPNSTLKFYRIPIKPKRRRLWLQALQQVNGSSEGLNGHVRICGAHFISGEASLDHNSPDFVPSVFTSIKSPPKKKVHRLFGHRRRRHHKIDVSKEEVQVPASAPAEPKEEETPAKEPEDETRAEPVTSETQSSPIKSLEPLKLPAGISSLDKMSPVVLIKHLCLPAGQYHLDLNNHNLAGVYNDKPRPGICENCGKQFTSQAGFSEHQCFRNVPEDEPFFPCNMCDKFFTTTHNLKRHKLLHVRDGRKCRQCGVLFCRRHKHVLFVPQVEPVTEYEQDSSAEELRMESSDVMPGNSSEQMETDDVDDDDDDDDTDTEEGSMTQTPAPPPNPPPLSFFFTGPLPNTITLPQSAIPLLRKPFPVLLPRPPVLEDAKNPSPTSFQPPPPDPPRKHITVPGPPPNIELPSSLKMFSPKFLTSALLEVKRNYEYILSKGKGVKEVPKVKEEPCELAVGAPPERGVGVDHEQSPPQEQIVAHEQSSEQVKKERTAYDLEIEV